MVRPSALNQMTISTVVDRFGGVPELRGDASVPGPDTGKSHKFRSYLRVLIDAFHLEDESFLWEKMVNKMKWNEMNWNEAMVVAILYVSIVLPIMLIHCLELELFTNYIEWS